MNCKSRSKQASSKWLEQMLKPESFGLHLHYGYCEANATKEFCFSSTEVYKHSTPDEPSIDSYNRTTKSWTVNHCKYKGK